METMGIFGEIESAGRASEGLIKAGFTEGQIESLSSIPYPEGVLVKSGRRSWFHWLSLAGGIAGAFAGFLLAAGTAWLYPVQTGDKPIIAFYPTGIITFEVAMLFAMVGAMAGMFLEMGLPSFRKRLYDPAIAEGSIGIAVSIYREGEKVTCWDWKGPGECIGLVASLSADEQKSLAEEIMMKAGALKIINEEAP